MAGSLDRFGDVTEAFSAGARVQVLDCESGMKDEGILDAKVSVNKTFRIGEIQSEVLRGIIETCGMGTDDDPFRMIVETREGTKYTLILLALAPKEEVQEPEKKPPWWKWRSRTSS